MVACALRMVILFLQELLHVLKMERLPLLISLILRKLPSVLQSILFLHLRASFPLSSYIALSAPLLLENMPSKI